MRLIPWPARDEQRLSRRQLRCLTRWIAESSAQRLAEVTPPPVPGLRLAEGERRRRDRRALRGEITVRNVTPGLLGPFLAAEVLDACADGLALRMSGPARSGHRLCLRIEEPAGAMEVLCTVRYCRPEGDGFVIGCGIGTAWGDGLAHAMLPPELARRRSA